MGYKKNITREDMWEIENSETTKFLTEKLEKEWNENAQRF
jgi:hypothetical protein